MSQRFGRSRDGLDTRVATVLVALVYGWCATLLIPSMLIGFAAYDHALPIAYDLARTAFVIAVIAGGMAAAALPTMPFGAGPAFLGAATLASGASLAAAATTDMPSNATVVLPTIFFFLAGPVLIVSGARRIVSAGFLGQISAAILIMLAIAAGAIAAFIMMADDIGVVRAGLVTAAVIVVALSAASEWRNRRPDLIDHAV